MTDKQLRKMLLEYFNSIDGVHQKNRISSLILLFKYRYQCLFGHTKSLNLKYDSWLCTRCACTVDKNYPNARRINIWFWPYGSYKTKLAKLLNTHVRELLLKKDV